MQNSKCRRETYLVYRLQVRQQKCINYNQYNIIHGVQVDQHYNNIETRMENAYKHIIHIKHVKMFGTTAYINAKMNHQPDV